MGLENLGFTCVYVNAIHLFMYLRMNSCICRSIPSMNLTLVASFSFTGNELSCGINSSHPCASDNTGILWRSYVQYIFCHENTSF